MKTNIKCLIFACFAFMASACVKNEIELPGNATEGVEITITAAREGFPGTRTVLESDGIVEWCPLDKISVFYNGTTNGDGGNMFTCQNTEQAAIAEFKGKVDGVIAGGDYFISGKYLYGVYPYSANTTFKDDVTTITLPFNQTAVEGTFSNGLFPTIARAKGLDLAFYNICGGVKFTVSRDDITSVSFKGNKNERLAGAANVIFDENAKPAVLDDEIEGKSEITVYAPAGGTFEIDKEYYIVAYPAKLTSGFTMTFRTSEMKEGTYVSNDSTLEIERSSWGILNQADKDVTSWTDITSIGGGDNSGIYLGIIGFNQQLYSYLVTELTQESKAGFNSFIDSLNIKNGTLLYCSVDQAINTLQSVPLPADLSTVAIVTFTDGLDKGSTYSSIYESDIEYLNALNGRIKEERVNGKPITAYSIGLKGSDVSDEALFQNNLEKLASSDMNAFQVSNMTEVNARFKEIAEQLSKSDYVQTLNLKVPGEGNGVLVRLTFDNVNSAEKSTLYIEGTFNRNENSLENVKYVGLESTSGTTVKGVVDGMFVNFTFEGVHTNNNKLISGKYTDEWTYVTSNDSWQINSEFDKTETSAVVTSRSSAAIMLVLDCSISLGTDFIKAQDNAKDFINTLYKAVCNDSGSDENPGANSAIYSTTPKDLSVAIWQDGVRYYLTLEQYKNVNLSNATIEGLAVLSNMGNFIISPNLIQSNGVFPLYAIEYYSNILPDKAQATVISTRYIDINNTLKSLEWTQFSINSGYRYLTKTSYSSDSYYAIDLYNYFGGNLAISSSFGYIRGVLPVTAKGPIIWNDERDLCLSVIKNGERIFLKNATEDLSQYDKIEGLAVVLGDNKFIIKLSNEQSGAVTVSSAMALYNSILPDKTQAEIISMKYKDINLSLDKFGGSSFSTNSGYRYLTKTSYSSNNNYAIYLYSNNGGNLTTYSSGYVRGVTNIE